MCLEWTDEKICSAMFHCVDDAANVDHVANDNHRGGRTADQQLRPEQHVGQDDIRVGNVVCTATHDRKSGLLERLH